MRRAPLATETDLRRDYWNIPTKHTTNRLKIASEQDDWLCCMMIDESNQVGEAEDEEMERSM